MKCSIKFQPTWLIQKLDTENGYNFNKKGGGQNRERLKQLYKLSTANKYSHANWCILKFTSNH